jgi:hypothetical protein
MPKRTPDQLIDRSQTKKIGDQLRAHYQAFATQELPPQLLAPLRKLDDEIELSAEQVEVRP